MMGNLIFSDGAVGVRETEYDGSERRTVKYMRLEVNWPQVSKRVRNKGCVHGEAAVLGIFGHTWAPVEGYSNIPPISLSF